MVDSMSSKPHFEAETNENTIIKDGNDYRIKPRGLSIIWGNDKRYWRLPERNNSDDVPAELLQVCWLEVTGFIELNKLLLGRKYNISFKIGMKPDAFGWSGTPIFMMAKIGKKGKYTWKSANLVNNYEPNEIPEGDALQVQLPLEAAEDEKLYFGLYEVWRGRWKGGLKIYEVLIKPVAEPGSTVSGGKKL